MLLQQIFLGYVTVLIVILGDAPEVVSMLSGTNHVRKSAPQSANLIVLLY